MTKDLTLRESIRWLDKGDKMVLQVLRIVSHLDQNRQSVVKYIWEDVPIVPPKLVAGVDRCTECGYVVIDGVCLGCGARNTPPATDGLQE